MRQIFVLSFTFLLFSAVAAAEEGFVSLFTPQADAVWTENGKALNGWVKRGGEATFAVDGDSLVGKRGPGSNSFLCTEKKYSNFILKFDVKYDIDCNSGVQFRSDVLTHDGKEVLFGYQCEIVPEKDTANVYDEHRRNRYLVPQTPELQEKIDKTFKKGDWNEIVIQCVGPSMKTWLNGEKITDFTDIETNKGIFGLQVHSGDQGQVRWRNIRIKELPATPWIAIYGDRKFGSFEIKPVGKWEFNQDENLIKASTDPGQPKDGILVSKDIYKNFAVKVSFKMEQGNSGLYFRAKENTKPYWLSGFQCEIAENPAVNAALWEVDGRGWVQKTKETEAVSSKVTKKSDWNDIATVAVGEHIVTFLNGQKVMDIIDPNPTHGFEGKVGLQLHGGGSQGCLFRDFYVMPLDDEAVKLIAK